MTPPKVSRSHCPPKEQQGLPTHPRVGAYLAWSMSHQKITLAHHGANDLSPALRSIACNTATTDAPCNGPVWTPPRAYPPERHRDPR